MKRLLMTAAAVCALGTGLAGCAGLMDAQAQTAAAAPAAAERFPATPEGAAAFIADAEARLAELSEYAARIAWVRATYITHDTMWLESRANAEFTELGVQLAT